MADDKKRELSLLDLGLCSQGDLGGGHVMISGLSLASHTVRLGHLFAAFSGSQTHGARYAQDAIERGARAVLTDREGADILKDLELSAQDRAQVCIVCVDDPRQAFARAAALWFGAQPKVAVAVTGTNGKTSVTSFARQIWECLELAAVNLGTTGVEGAWSAPLAHTTPDALTLHDMLSQAAQHGVTHVAMEASSHGLDQKRLDGVALTAVGFTNFTQDHLDYHRTFEAYFDAKLGLFTRLLPCGGTAVLNADDPKSSEVEAALAARDAQIVRVGCASNADLQILGRRYLPSGQEVRFTYGGVTYQKTLSLIGGFQAENALLAAGLVIAAGESPAAVFETLSSLDTVRGRMQTAAQCQHGASVFVDYAHTPDAVETALRALRPHVMGRLVVIVGAGGDRDRAKRPLMGAAAAAHADVVIVSDDNPRSEDPASIRAAVLEGVQSAASKAQVLEVGDRAEAILRAVDMLKEGDALLIAGKGHETGQIIGDHCLPFDDAEQASLAVAALEGNGS